MFEKLTVTKAIKENVRKYRNKEFSIPVVYCKFGDNGIMYWGREGEFTTFENVISVVYNGVIAAGKVYAQKQATGILAESYFIRLKQHKASHNVNLYLATVLEKVLYPKYSRDYLATWDNKVENDIIVLPTKNNKIDFDFIEEFIAELEERSVAELEEWLRAAGFEDYNLTEGEQIALKEIDKLEYQIFNVEELFGKSTRGKRLKSADRVTGSLPFVTAGETAEGISAFIGNRVTIFPANTTTIDMFGSAKYRNYEYGADDHIAVVHTQKLQEDAAIFVTSAIHKSSHNGQFDYGKNFYAKDADELNILLPTKGVVPDYSKMATIISAVKKLVIKDVAEYANKKIRVAQQVIAK